MVNTMNDILHPGRSPVKDFPHAPAGWSQNDALTLAAIEELVLEADHWEIIQILQAYFSQQEDANIRRLHDALNEHFHSRGGLKYLYKILPKGPVAQGCRLAGIRPPAGSTSESFGSVQ
ncbi:MAG: TusE/DsrC/DsvC family sulfur relay protein [Parasphingorhabdus sp.]|jgi:TusE/DsrC/DsvC family sulfur relay protein